MPQKFRAVDRRLWGRVSGESSCVQYISESVREDCGWYCRWILHIWCGVSAWAASAGYGTIAAGAIGGAAAGFASGGIQGGNLQSALTGAFTGALTGGAGAYFGGAETLGRAVGGGINGYLQTGNGEGFARGFAAGLLPDDLWLTSAYQTSGLANIVIGVVRDGARGAIAADNRSGFARGVAIEQATNAIGHVLGIVTTGGLPKFDRGAFVYEGGIWNGTGGALTLGNVISGPDGLSTSARYKTVYAHERNHIFQAYERSLGALYIPAHFLEVAAGCIGGALGYGTRGYIFEEHLQNIPYSIMGVNPCGR